MALLDRLQFALDAIYPPRCLACGGVVSTDGGLCGPCFRDTAFIGETICDCCGTPLPGEARGETLYCDTCLEAPPPWSHGRAAFVYRDAGRRMVLALKHGDRQEIAQPAARWMAAKVQNIVSAETLIAPVPLHWRRMVRRRYNQSALLARALAREVGATPCLDLLHRVRATPSLDGLGRVDRSDTVAEAFQVHPRRLGLIADRPVLLVDDVMTTGSTLAACTLACIEAGSGPVSVAVLARVAKEP